MVDIESAGLSDFDGHERGPYLGGVTVDLDGVECGEVARKNGTVSVIRGRLLANMVEIASRAARKLADNLDDKRCYRAIALFVFLRSNAILTRTSREKHLWVRGIFPG